MRRKVAQVLLTQCFQHYQDNGLPLGPRHAGLKMKRGPKRMRQLRLQREARVDELVARGVARAVAEILIPAPEPFGVTVVRADARGAYRRLKRAYTRRSR